VKAEMANESMGEWIKPLADLGQKLTHGHTPSAS
jgi:hypothetical protein